MKIVTVEECKAAAFKKHGKSGQIPVRKCSICEAILQYEFHEDDVRFDANCDCTSHYSPPRQSSWSDVAKLINIQNNENAQKEIMANVGDFSPPVPIAKTDLGIAELPMEAKGTAMGEYIYLGFLVNAQDAKELEEQALAKGYEKFTYIAFDLDGTKGGMQYEEFKRRMTMDLN